MNIFISYSSKDRVLVQELATDLNKLGHQTWFDQDLTGGQAWWDTILSQIRQADLVVFALTPNSLESHPCKLEYTYGMGLGKLILPVILKPVNLETLPPTLSAIQYVEYHRKGTLQMLSRAIANLPAASPPSAPTLPAIPLSPFSKLGVRISAPTLDFNEQAALIIQIKELLKDGEARSTSSRELLEKFRRRPDLFASIQEEIDTLLLEKKPKSSPRNSRLWLLVSILTGVVALSSVGIILLGQMLTSRNPSPTDQNVASPTQETPSVSINVSDAPIMFYNMNNGSNSFWGLTTAGQLNDLHKTDSTIGTDWTQIVKIGDSSLLFYNSSTGKIGIIKMDGAGNITFISNPDTILSTWTNLVSVGNRMVLFYRTSDGGTDILQFDETGGYKDLNQIAGLGVGWTQLIRTSDGHVLIYNGSTGDYQTLQIAIDNSGQITTQDSGKVDSGALISSVSDNLVLLYTAITGNTQLENLDSMGKMATIPANTQEPGWTTIAKLADGLLLFYNTSTGDSRTFQVDNVGILTQLASGFLGPNLTHIISSQ